MNRIRNVLGPPSPQIFEHIQWEPSNEKAPEVKRSIASEAAPVWKAYFDLLFIRFHLLNRFKNYSVEMKEDAPDFYKFMYPDGSNLDKKKLLELLIGDPRDYTTISVSGDEVSRETIKKVFNYDYLTNRYRNEFAELVQMIGVNVCPYCGRSFTTTVKKQREGYIRANQVDHFFPQSDYPWLALSIWNMIPSCGPCNNMKQDKLTPILYPYAEEMGDVYRFHTHPTKGMGYLVGARDAETMFQVKLEPTDKSAGTNDFLRRTQNEIEMLGINDLYSGHNDYVSKIFRQRYIFGTPYIDSLLASFPDLFHSRDDVRAMLYMKRVDAESIGTEPLDKLTRDIDSEIDQFTEEPHA